MPKSLSLKKVKPGELKNQKAITQFFNHKPPSEKTKDGNSTIKEQEMQQNGALKRKAMSHIKLKSSKKDAPDQKLLLETVDSTELCKNVAKKQKYDTTSVKDSLTSNITTMKSKKSPLKENSTEKSPKKYKITEDKILYKTEVDKKKRSPLNKVENVQKIMKNEDIVENNHVFKNIFTIENNLLNKSPEKTTKKLHLTPEKTPGNAPSELRRSPRLAKLKTPDKNSPSLVLNGSSVKVALDFGLEDVDDMFGDIWDCFDNQDCKEDIDLSNIQRCEVLSVNELPISTEIRVKNSSGQTGTCLIEGIWRDTPLVPGEIISISALRDPSGHWSVTNSSGLLVLRPDHLMSATSVVAGVFCKRKAVLQERFKGIDSANNAMSIGILVHELVQRALVARTDDVTTLRETSEAIVAQSTGMLYDAGMSVEETLASMHTYLQPLAEFMRNYVVGQPLVAQKDKNQWNGHIDEILDIEENVCCPQLGLKGKIDATLQVTIHEKKEKKRLLMPLELKSGRASFSSEHLGQLAMYGMMLSVQHSCEPPPALLLYLRDRVDIRQVSCGYPERRDLMMLRNQLVQYLTTSPQDQDPESVTDIEDAARLLHQRLPEPVHHQTACAKCPYVTLCELHLWHTEGPTVSDKHPLAQLREQALGHLSEQHVKYFLHWSALLKMEERGQLVTSPLHALWTEDVEKRRKRGVCADNLKLKSVEPSGDRFLHKFDRNNKEKASENIEAKQVGPQEGEFSIVSIQNRPWIAAGVVTLANTHEMQILLERDLSRRLSKETPFHIDTYESYATTVQNLTNLGVIMEDSDRALRLRSLIIDKSEPYFEKKLPRDVGRLGAKLMRSLNIEQQRAVLKALSAKDYALLQGLPGTGKTQTISVLIQMLVALKHRVLVTAHTHSAVDTVLTRLPQNLKIMRLGSSSRVAPSLLQRSEQQLTEKCDSPESLAQVYESMEVVGVTCLGAAHAMLTRTTFDVCIVDEATQVLQCTVLRPLLAAKRFVLVGDPDQLPPVVRSRAARRLGMEESLFHRLSDAGATTTLSLQYRMNHTLASLANRVAYDGRLKCADERVRDAVLDVDGEVRTVKGTFTYPSKMKISSGESIWLLTVCSNKSENAAIFVDMGAPSQSNLSGKNRSLANTHEACVALAIIDALILGGVNAQDIGIIAPYREQVSLLRRSVTKLNSCVEVSTVDQFQGKDKSVIIYSCTRCDEGREDQVKEGEVLNDQRRLAVSVTRAKHKLIIIGHRRVLQRYDTLSKVIDACVPVNLDKEAKKCVIEKHGSYVK